MLEESQKIVRAIRIAHYKWNCTQKKNVLLAVSLVITFSHSKLSMGNWILEISVRT